MLRGPSQDRARPRDLAALAVIFRADRGRMGRRAAAHCGARTRGRSAERTAVGNLALGDCENDGTVVAGEAGHENLRLEARHAFRAQAGRTHHLTPDELVRLVERGELRASPDRPDAYSNTLEIAPGRARGFSGHAGPSWLRR